VIESYLVFILAGFATGIITGLVGASSIVAFIPIVLLFLNYSIFALIGVGLAVDAFITLFAIFIYRKFHNIDFKTGFYLAIPAVFGAILGSYLSKFLPNTNLLWISSILTAITGILIYNRKANKNESYDFKDYSKFKFTISIIASFFIGLLGGAFGGAGGIGIFLLLIFFLNFETHHAVGTSIFVMFFIALFGSISHIHRIDAMGFHWELLVFAVIGGILGAFFSSRIANLVSEKKLNKLVGIVLFALGILALVHRILM
jgi:uncharacterized membrane protein YfcA